MASELARRIEEQLIDYMRGHSWRSVGPNFWDGFGEMLIHGLADQGVTFVGTPRVVWDPNARLMVYIHGLDEQMTLGEFLALPQVVALTQKEESGRSEKEYLRTIAIRAAKELLTSQAGEETMRVNLYRFRKLRKALADLEARG